MRDHAISCEGKRKYVSLASVCEAPFCARYAILHVRKYAPTPPLLFFCLYRPLLPRFREFTRSIFRDQLNYSSQMVYSHSLQQFRLRGRFRSISLKLAPNFVRTVYSKQTLLVLYLRAMNHDFVFVVGLRKINPNQHIELASLQSITAQKPCTFRGKTMHPHDITHKTANNERSKHTHTSSDKTSNTKKYHKNKNTFLFMRHVYDYVHVTADATFHLSLNHQIG